MTAQIAAKLDESRALIEKGWDRYNYTSTGEGIRRTIKRKRLPKGTCFCSLGALARVTGEMPYGDVGPTIQAAIPFLGAAIGLAWTPDHCDISRWNGDVSGSAEVIEAFRKAAELARAEAL
jgi:hypothetical protein